MSFRTQGGATFAQLAAMMWLFVLGLAALCVFVLARARQDAGANIATLVLLLVGYISLGILDPWAARRGEAPLFFVRLRPVQMLIPVASLAALIGLRLVR